MYSVDRAILALDWDRWVLYSDRTVHCTLYSLAVRVVGRLEGGARGQVCTTVLTALYRGVTAGLPRHPGPGRQPWHPLPLGTLVQHTTGAAHSPLCRFSLTSRVWTELARPRPAFNIFRLNGQAVLAGLGALIRKC